MTRKFLHAAPLAVAGLLLSEPAFAQDAVSAEALEAAARPGVLKVLIDVE